MDHHQKTPLAVIYAVAADLDFAEDGIVICGVATKLACDEAIDIAARYGFENCIMLFTATNDGDKWYGQKMGRIMQAHVQKLCPDIQTHYEEAPSFNTFGECVAIARFIIKNRDRQSLKNLVLVVKDWHALRTEFAQRLIFWRHRYSFPLACETHQGSASLFARLLELPKMALVLVRAMRYKPII